MIYIIFEKHYLTTSPGLVAILPGIFSHKGIKTFKCIGNFIEAAEYKQPVTHAAPPISARILSISLLGLIDIPPVSKVTPLPTKIMGSMFTVNY